MSRNQREGKLYGKYRGRVRRIGTTGFDWDYYIPFETSEADFKATRKERRQHKLDQSFIRRLQARREDA